MIDLDYNAPQPSVHQKVAEALVEAFHKSGLEAAVIKTPDAEECCLQSPILKLIKERNEARKLCALVVDALPDLTHCFSSDKAMRAALEQIHVATITFLKASKQWDKRSYKTEGAE